MQPTSPLRKTSLFKNKIKLLDKKNINSIISVKNIYRSEEFIFKIKKNNIIKLKKSIRINPNRQRNNKLFTPCGGFYATRSNLLIKNKSFYNLPVIGVETQFPENIDIDTDIDLKIAKTFKF